MTAPLRLTSRGKVVVRAALAFGGCCVFMVGVFAPFYWVRVR